MFRAYKCKKCFITVTASGKYTKSNDSDCQYPSFHNQLQLNDKFIGLR